jgi:hypothetical protein
MVATKKKSNSDRPLNPKNHDRLSTKNQIAIAPSTSQHHDRHSKKIKQRSPPHIPKHHDRLQKFSIYQDIY